MADEDFTSNNVTKKARKAAAAAPKAHTRQKNNSAIKKSTSSFIYPKNVLPIEAKRIEKYDLIKWQQEYANFLAPLNEHEFELVQTSFNIIFKRPRKKYPEPAPVIPFPIQNAAP